MAGLENIRLMGRNAGVGCRGVAALITVRMMQ
jgi:hypothetical protein